MGSGASSGGGGAPANQGGMLDVAPVAHMLGKTYQVLVNFSVKGVIRLVN